MKSKVYKRSQIFPQFFCRSCGKVVSPGTKYCNRCKNDIKVREKDIKAWQDTIDDYTDELEEY